MQALADIAIRIGDYVWRNLLPKQHPQKAAS
jgi:hypothetical protein